MKRPDSLDLEALRTFVTGIELGNFSLAAKRLSRSTSAVSAQLKKLEHQCGIQLLCKEGRHLKLTDQGELLVSYGKKILSLNDEALQVIHQKRILGKVSLGVQEDFSDKFLPELLSQISRKFPNIQIYAQSGRNSILKEEILQNKIDFALCWESPQEVHERSLIKTLPQHWVASPAFDFDSYIISGKPLPLILVESPCIIRDTAIQALDQENISWQIAVSGGSLHGIWGAVKAGLGITVRTSTGIPDSLVIIDQHLPPLPGIGLSLFESSSEKSDSYRIIKELLLHELEYYFPEL
nr:LysR substrate-binding domain-containing protein [Photobacterium salinisoli]